MAAKDENQGLMRLRKQMQKRTPKKLFPTMDDLLEQKGKGKKGK
jgi:hypothetical protein